MWPGAYDFSALSWSGYGTSPSLLLLGSLNCMLPSLAWHAAYRRLVSREFC